MKIYNIFCASFYQLLLKFKSNESEFFIYLLISFLIGFNCSAIIDIYTYYFNKETFFNREYLLGLTFIFNGVFFYFKADYKKIRVNQKQYFIVMIYFILSFIVMIIFLKLHHDRNIISDNNSALLPIRSLFLTTDCLMEL